jgi:peptidoglycan/xylan/chitin deacetylase (PgdA/CDA1 family)
MFICSDIVGTRRPFWFLHVADEVVDDLARVGDGERVERLRGMGVREDADADRRDALSRDEILQLAGELVDFQSHTATHPFLPRCSDEKARDEIFRAKSDLEREYGFEIYALSYPNGDYLERDVQFARDAGYTCACTTKSGFNTDRTDPFRIKRIPIDDEDGVDALVVKASGLWGVIRPRTRRVRRGRGAHDRARGYDARTSGRGPGTR